jgi:hypothetical protein
MRMRCLAMPVLLVALSLAVATHLDGATSTCGGELALTFDRTRIWRAQTAFFFMAGMAVDADGAPNAYGPPTHPSLDYLANAGHPGNWWGIVTENGTTSGTPYVQPDGDYKGFYLSPTSLQDMSKGRFDRTRYVDARTVPYYVLPKGVQDALGIHLGDLAVVYNTKNEKLTYSLLGDTSKVTIGEGSIALAADLGMRTDLRDKKRGSGQDAGVLYLIVPGTHATPPWPRDVEDIRQAAERAFAAWGGLNRLKSCIK